ncbi:MAG: SPFH domain-containing protein [Lachnospiraceae bacterium]|nr:SPFH domain-containing protein [Lachnospiraceae bacterium]MDD7548183.1 SPFH domain-containing protein [Lachnospiraceae bacterium]
MGIFKNQLLNVVEWTDEKEGQLFWMWDNDEIKKGSKLVLRPGQDAIFIHNGAVEGVFEEDGTYDIETEIIPFLSTLKGFKFGFNSGFRAEVLFINTKEQTVKWGTKNAINLPAAGLPGGMPIRAFGTFSCKIADHDVVIDKLAGVKNTYSVADVKERITATLDQTIMSWIAKEGKDMFNLQVYAREIAEGVRSDLDADMSKIGISITDFTIESFSYPEEVKKMQEKAAAQSMVGDVNKYTQMAMADSMEKGGGNVGGNMASTMMQMQMGMAMGQQMVNTMNQGGVTGAAPQAAAIGAKFCPNCGTPANGAKFCSNCGTQLA